MKSAKLVKALIGDGQELTFTYKPTPENDYTGVEIVCRPCTQDEVHEFHNSAKSVIEKSRELILKKLVGWNILRIGSESEVAPVTADTIKMLPYPVVGWMVDAMIGHLLSDGAAALKN